MKIQKGSVQEQDLNQKPVLPNQLLRTDTELSKRATSPERNSNSDCHIARQPGHHRNSSHPPEERRTHLEPRQKQTWKAATTPTPRARTWKRKRTNSTGISKQTTGAGMSQTPRAPPRRAEGDIDQTTPQRSLTRAPLENLRGYLQPLKWTSYHWSRQPDDIRDEPASVETPEASARTRKSERTREVRGPLSRLSTGTIISTKEKLGHHHTRRHQPQARNRI
ncbi:hypothetical protein Bca4012_083145 [Brassica carinata]